MGKAKNFLKRSGFWLAVGTLYVAGSVSSYLHDKPYTGQLYQKQNISSIETIIEEQNDYFKNVPPCNTSSTLPERKAVEVFESEVKSELEKFLDVPEIKAPPIHSDFPDPINLLIAGFLGAFGLLLTYKSVKYLIKFSESLVKKDKDELVASIVGGVGYLLISSYSFSMAANLIWTNSYNQLSKSVSITYTDKKNFVIDTPEKLSMVIAHEVTHHLQDEKDVDNLLLKEGHAIGVARNVGRTLYEKTKNPDFLEVQKFEQRYFVSVYLALCEKFNVQPKEELIKEIEPVHLEEHSLGGALFALKEAQWGDEIYSDILKGDYSKLLSVPKEGDKKD